MVSRCEMGEMNRLIEIPIKQRHLLSNKIKEEKKGEIRLPTLKGCNIRNKSGYFGV